MVDNVNELWSTLSRKVLSSVLVDDGAVFPVINVVKNNSKWFAPKERPVWRVVLQCLEASTPPTVEAVTARLNGNCDPGYVQHLATLFNDDDNRRLIYNTEQLKKVGILAGIRDIGRTLSQISSIDDIESAIDSANTEIAGLYAEKNDRQQDPKTLDEIAWGQVEQFSEIVIPTGLGWFDKLAGGLWPGMNYWIVAAYKGRKTTLMRNMFLAAAQAGYPVAAYCAEGTRELFALDCQVMLATKILYDKYGWEGRNKLRLARIFVQKNWRIHRDKPVFTADEYQALQQARELWRGLPVRVYDTVDGIRDLTTLQYDIKRDRLEHGTIAVWLDFSQLFGRGKTLFEKQSTTAQRVQEIAQLEGVALTVLAQRNEETIKGGGGYSPGVKGGGDAPAAADFLIVPKIDPDDREVLSEKLTHSRHTETGTGAHYINPATGLILREATLKTRDLND